MRQTDLYWACDGCTHEYVSSPPMPTWEYAEEAAFQDGWTRGEDDITNIHYCPTCSHKRGARQAWAEFKRINAKLCREWGVEQGRSYVYYAVRGNYTKIGFSTAVPERLVRLRAGLQAAEPGGRELERERHEQFRRCRVGCSEWFDAYDPDLRSWLSQLEQQLEVSA